MRCRYLHAVIVAVHLSKAEPPSVARAACCVVVANGFEFAPHLTREYRSAGHGKRGARLRRWRLHGKVCVVQAFEDGKNVMEREGKRSCYE